MKKYLAIIFAVIMLASLTACGSDTKGSSSATEATSQSEPETQEATLTAEKGEVKDSSPAIDQLEKAGYDTSLLNEPKVNYADKDFGFQLEKPEKGDTVAVIKTSMGDITLRFFPEYAPNTVNNFVELAKAGKYDGVLFHRVMNDFMIQTGDCENNNGTGGTSIYGSAFEDEFCDKLLNIRGSVAMANSGRDTNGSQFFINQSKSSSAIEQYKSNWKSIVSQLKATKDQPSSVAVLNNYGTSCPNTDAVPDEMVKLYEENGGNIWLDGAYNPSDAGHTVFAQVIDGMDVVDKIAAVDVDSTTSKPLEDVTIDTVEIKEY